MSTPRPPSDAALSARARLLIERMTELTRWVYAIPPDEADRHLDACLADGVFEADPSDRSRWSGPGKDGAARFEVRRDEQLGVVFVELRGEAGMPALATLLSATGFYAQSTLLKTAWDFGSEEQNEALRTLAPMVATWDDDWVRLFRAHLTCDEREIREGAAAALREAIRGAGEPPPGLALAPPVG